jgi:hypothetical protein
MVEVLAGAGPHRQCNTREKDNRTGQNMKKENVNFKIKPMEERWPGRIGKAAGISCWAGGRSGAGRW